MNIPYIPQEINSYDCGLACLVMFLSAYDISDTMDDIKKEINIYDNIGTYAPQLAHYLQKKLDNIVFTSSNPSLFTKSMRGSQWDSDLCNELLTKPSGNTTDMSRTIGWIQKFVNIGGSVSPKLITTTLLKNIIDSRSPIIVNVTSQFLYSDKPIFNFHFVVVFAYNSDVFMIHDPYKSDIKYISSEELLFAIHAASYGSPDNASIIYKKII